MKPYYQTKLGKVYHGDCLEVMKNIQKIDAVITDPVWPNFLPGIISSKTNPYKLFKKASKLFIPKTKRVVVQLGCDSDPVFLKPLAKKMKFFRVMWLRYALPSRKGRVLYSGDVAYCYGDPPKSRKGNKLISGEVSSHCVGRNKYTIHPCPRHLKHVMFLVDKMSNPGELILDPFAGSGTTGIACEALDRKYILIENNHKYCEEIKQRLIEASQKRKLFNLSEF